MSANAGHDSWYCEHQRSSLPCSVLQQCAKLGSQGLLQRDGTATPPEAGVHIIKGARLYSQHQLRLAAGRRTARLKQSYPDTHAGAPETVTPGCTSYTCCAGVQAQYMRACLHLPFQICPPYPCLLVHRPASDALLRLITVLHTHSHGFLEKKPSAARGLLCGQPPCASHSICWRVVGQVHALPAAAQLLPAHSLAALNARSRRCSAPRNGNHRRWRPQAPPVRAIASHDITTPWSQGVHLRAARSCATPGCAWRPRCTAGCRRRWRGGGSWRPGTR